MKKVVSLLIILGSLLWSLTMVKSGFNYSYGLGFWGPNGHDGVWHIALINKLAKFNFDNPVFSGETIKNYHIGFDSIVALINFITKLPINNLYFQILPPVFALLIGYLTYKFVFLWTKSIKSSLLSTFFVYFGGSFAWVLGKGESAFWSQQAISTLVNPPFALSLIILLLGLIALIKNKKILAVLAFGVLIQIKAYAGILVLGALLVSGNFAVFLGTLLLSALIFLPFNKEAVTIISWQPFWFVETMMGLGDRIGWQRFYSAMTTYKMGNIFLKEIAAYLVAFLIFVFGNFWTRLIFLRDIFKKPDRVKIFLLSIVVAGLMIPTFFVQRGTPWNTIQFMYYSLFFTGILTGIALSRVKSYILILIVLLTIPTTIITLKEVYIPSRPPAKLSINEHEALNYLKTQPDGTVLTYPYDADKAYAAIDNPPRPLYLYESTAYVSAYSDKTIFLEDEVNLNITGYDWKIRKEKILDWYKESEQEKARNFLKDNNIKYIYWVIPQRALLGESQLGLTKIFENKEVMIFSVGK